MNYKDYIYLGIMLTILTILVGIITGVMVCAMVM